MRVKGRREVIKMDNMINTGFIANAGNQYTNRSAGSQERPDISFADRMAERIAAAPEDMTLKEYKAYINEKINNLYIHPSQRNVFWYIDITDAAYQRMQSDPVYEQRVLDYLEKNKAVNCGRHAPRFVFIHIEDTWEKSYGYSMGVQDNDRFSRYQEERRRAAKIRAKKERRKKLLKEYLKKKAEAKRLQDMLLNKEMEKRRLENGRIIKKWNAKRRAVQAARAYEASLIMRYRSGG